MIKEKEYRCSRTFGDEYLTLPQQLLQQRLRKSGTTRLEEPIDSHLAIVLLHRQSDLRVWRLDGGFRGCRRRGEATKGEDYIMEHRLAAQERDGESYMLGQGRRRGGWSAYDQMEGESQHQRGREASCGLMLAERAYIISLYYRQAGGARESEGWFSPANEPTPQLPSRLRRSSPRWPFIISPRARSANLARKLSDQLSYSSPDELAELQL